MDDAVDARVPGGVLADGARLTEVELRKLNGHDQEVLLALAGAPAAHAARVLLDRCVRAIGGRAVRDGAIAGMAIGDAEALLWHLRITGFGDRVTAVVECRECSEKLDVDLRVSELLQPAYPRWTATFTEDLAGRRVTFRLPVLGDQEAVGKLARTSHEAAGRALLERCVLAVDGRGPTGDALAAVRPAVEDRIAALDPQAETLLDVRCPECNTRSAHLLDAAGFLVEELTRTGHYLAREVHTIAWYYHWSEDAILGLPVDKRRRYLDLIQDTVGASP